ncbi:oxidoreductase [Pseudoxanthomonas spadix]|uniref:oxidoreductase n=1 Tax=Pseudoxanthomonas spadix TaxID=415229 RepID=UPI000F00FB7A|nr:oxidoreductase [Pseudoxanthomonas spadix]MBP3974364.1 SDR family NAD(P)-dependent oxidoreductase [Pseudoxanthomonas spadix]RMW97445.1 SDR family NAD(P)-dependent oxidoreductase [Pseudoxanthomonas spadix]
MPSNETASSKQARVWLITGAGSGLGRALVDAVLAQGDCVAGTVRRPADAQVLEALAPGRVMVVRLDVTDAPGVRTAVAAVEARFGGRIDVLVNNAGYGLVAGVEEASLAEVRAQFEVNVFGALSMMQAVLPAMRRRRAGTIVNVTSVSGLVGWPGLGIYSGSKFALEGISETLAQEVAGFGIRVVMVEPGGFRTDFAGRSRALAAQPINDDGYLDGALGACKRTLDAHAGHERGDPARAALAICKVVAAEAAPLRLLLGADALGYVLGKQAHQQAELARWLEVTTSTDFPG